MDKINISKIAEVCDVPIYENIVVVDDIRYAYDSSASKQFLVEGFIFCLVLKGSARMIVDEVEYKLERGNIFGCNPHNILEKSTISMDFRILGIFVTPEYASLLLSKIPIDWSFLMMAHTHEVLHINEEEIERFVGYIELLRKKLSAKETKYKEESIELLIESMGLELFDIHQRENVPIRETTYSSGENVAQRFMMMLAESNQNGKPYLNVNGYADRLHISPKYFSLVCRNIFGKTASEIIQEDIMRTAVTLLHDNSLNIKQISDRLGFANQSHFGTFVRRHSGGRSPQDLRIEK